ncbi:MAG TPA: MarR family transcriptional regulator [archaeon]|nr:MarR family transcriptional regulator [archaeon]
MKRFAILLLALLLVPSAAAAPSLEYLGLEHKLGENGTALGKLTLSVGTTVSTLDYRFPYRISGLAVASNFPDATCVPADFAGWTGISCAFAKATSEKNQVVLTYAIPEAYGTSIPAIFSASYDVPLPVKEAFVSVRLPPGIFLDNSTGEPYFPADGSILTDGRSITVYWDYQNVTTDQTIPVRVRFTLPSSGEQPTDYLIPALALLAILAVALASYFTHQYTKRRARSAVAAVLNPDEHRLIGILKAKGGKALQKMLVRETDFSKAKVSRLVNSLKSRGIVAVEAVSGRENRIVLTLGEGPKPAEKTEPEAKGQKGEAQKESHERKGEATPRPLLRPSRPDDRPEAEEGA